MPRPIDHLVVAVPDLAAAIALYRATGFTVGTRNLHPWGTENAVVALDGSYIELIGLVDGYRPPPPDDPAAPFADAVAGAVARGGGLCALALGSVDADADAASLRAAGLGQGRRLDFARGALAPDGTTQTLRFSIAFAAVPGLPEAAFFTCRHHQPLGSTVTRSHANGAVRLETVVLASDDPPRLGSLLAPLIGVAPAGPAGRPAFDTSTGRLVVMGPVDAEARYGSGAVAGRFAAFAVVVDAPGPVRALLDAERVPHAEIAGAVVVPPGAAFGVALAFAPAACHSGR